MKQLREIVRDEWDRVATDLLFITFGVWSLVDRPKSFRTTPEMFIILFNVEFIVIGLLLLVGTLRRDYRLKVAGFALYIVALLTIAGLVSVVGSSTVSILLLAFAIRGYTSIRELRMQRQFLHDLRNTLRSPPGD